MVQRNGTAVLLAGAVLVSVGVAAYAGFRLGHDEERPAGGALPEYSRAAPGSYPPAAVPVSVAPEPPAPSSVFRTPPATKTTSPPATKTTSPPARKTTAPPATKTMTPAWAERTIVSTSVLTTGQSWATNRLRLTVTAGGNLELRDQGRLVWQTGTSTGVKLVMQNDGHLVLYDAENGTAWSSGTAGHPGAVLTLRADGTMVITLNGRVLFRAG
ncbi:hypothetical protein AB0J83_20165 [Actinoplanes sp. NPDC049596]|uniref:hypothetical protein n=1 Tax=unclassified Actinoplanes TaxID=2626549 RepID=UPI00341276AD